MARTLRRTLVAGRYVGPGDRREIAANASTPAGVMIDHAAPSAGAIRRCVAEQICPFCGRGPYKMLPVHTNKSHGVDKWELRELAGMSTTETLCSPESVDAMRAAAARNGSPGRERATEASRTRRAQRWTSAGRERNAATLRAWESAYPDEAAQARSAAGRRGAAARWVAPPAVAVSEARDTRVTHAAEKYRRVTTED